MLTFHGVLSLPVVLSAFWQFFSSLCTLLSSSNAMIKVGHSVRGTIVNVLVIILGSILGHGLKNRFPKRIQERTIQGMGLAVLLIGLRMALQDQRILLIIFSLIIGAVLGELLYIEERLNRVGLFLHSTFNTGGEGDQFTEGFLRASLLFCIGAMAILGSLQEGIQGDPGILYAKSVLDGFSSLAFASTMGMGVAFSAVPVFLYQGSITLLAGFIEGYLTTPAVDLMTATGGLLIMGIGINMLELGRIRVGNLLPAIFVALVFGQIF